ncbi:MAG: trypsin-like peptidase domain-containing protein [Bacteroidota bacterium]
MKQVALSAITALIVSVACIATYHYLQSPSAKNQGENKTEAETSEDLFARQVKQEDMPQFVSANSGLSQAPQNFNFAAQKAMPAVVHIKSFQSYQRNENSFDNFYYELFGIKPQRYKGNQQQSSGSGVIISPDGYIVTNNHVIKDADVLEVSLSDNRSYKATVIGTDPSTDLGLIKIDAKELPSLSLANSDESQVGDWVLAVGNPFSLASTATAGIVSAIGRDLEIIKDRMAIESFIQTDAAVNPGNSGGALVNLEGNLIGINTAIASPTGAYAGYAFAVPANIVKKVITDLKKYGSVQRAFLGVVNMKALSGDLSKKLGIDLTEGVYVQELTEQGGAYRAGLLEGDVIVSIDGVKTRNEAKLLELIGRNRPGDQIDVKVYREKKYKSIRVTLTNAYGETVILAPERNETLNELGLSIRDLSGEEMSRLNIEQGILVEKLYAGLLRSQTSIRENFIILKFNNEMIESAIDFTNALEKSKGVLRITGFYPRYNRLQSYEFEMSPEPEEN